MSSNLPPRIEEQIQTLVSTGRFTDATDVIEQALTLLSEREQKLERLRNELALGELQEQRGEVHELTPERIEHIKHQARENWRNGERVKRAVRP
ncbi:MAG TPA: type II toxin-antitoxin system ParD family antitoxin [Thermomicrobiales bacterium]|nr:type II toxin-antitoxin system ParD family antitoxin [Thermomicrobiales bacterium]